MERNFKKLDELEILIRAKIAEYNKLADLTATQAGVKLSRLGLLIDETETYKEKEWYASDSCEWVTSQSCSEDY